MWGRMAIWKMFNREEEKNEHDIVPLGNIPLGK